MQVYGDAPKSIPPPIFKHHNAFQWAPCDAAAVARCGYAFRYGLYGWLSEENRIFPKNILHNKVHIYTKIQKSNYHLY